MGYNHSGNIGAASICGILVFWLAIVVTIGMGWVMNIMALFNSAGPVLETGVGIVRLIGVFIVPVGAIMGWFVN